MAADFNAEAKLKSNPFALVKIIEESVRTKRGYLLPEIAGLYKGVAY